MSHVVNFTFYQHLLHHYSFDKRIQTQTIIRGNMCKKLLYKKYARKISEKLTPGRPHPVPKDTTPTKVAEVPFISTRGPPESPFK